MPAGSNCCSLKSLDSTQQTGSGLGLPTLPVVFREDDFGEGGVGFVTANVTLIEGVVLRTLLTGPSPRPDNYN